MNAPPTPAAGLTPSLSWTIPLPFLEPLTLNARGHHMALYRQKRAWKDAVTALTRRYKVPALDRYTVVLHLQPRVNRDRDLDNLAGHGLKAAVDGYCVASGAKDTAEHYLPSRAVLHPATGEPNRLWLVIHDLSGDVS